VLVVGVPRRTSDDGLCPSTLKRELDDDGRHCPRSDAVKSNGAATSPNKRQRDDKYHAQDTVHNSPIDPPAGIFSTDIRSVCGSIYRQPRAGELGPFMEESGRVEGNSVKGNLGLGPTSADGKEIRLPTTAIGSLRGGDGRLFNGPHESLSTDPLFWTGGCRFPPVVEGEGLVAVCEVLHVRPVSQPCKMSEDGAQGLHGELSPSNSNTESGNPSTHTDSFLLSPMNLAWKEAERLKRIRMESAGKDEEGLISWPEAMITVVDESQYCEAPEFPSMPLCITRCPDDGPLPYKPEYWAWCPPLLYRGGGTRPVKVTEKQ
jgi:hypothetical protein